MTKRKSKTLIAGIFITLLSYTHIVSASTSEESNYLPNENSQQELQVENLKENYFRETFLNSNESSQIAEFDKTEELKEENFKNVFLN